ncbi:hypothetical protein CMO88_03295 [Candidatus Woesearchaeota archaeon]|nr:hypothetical protein [Candidatus Woesearchaeota archaeon]|tara:strand:+ start:2698 stop:3219 length:522 start_codon:yes stop_codon:yes gene_type:complete
MSVETLIQQVEKNANFNPDDVCSLLEDELGYEQYGTHGRFTLYSNNDSYVAVARRGSSRSPTTGIIKGSKSLEEDLTYIDDLFSWQNFRNWGALTIGAGATLLVDIAFIAPKITSSWMLAGITLATTIGIGALGYVGSGLNSIRQNRQDPVLNNYEFHQSAVKSILHELDSYE